MIKKSLIIPLLLLTLTLWAENNELSLLRNVTLNIMVNNVDKANSEMESIIEQYNLIIGMNDENNTKKSSDYQLHAQNDMLMEVLEQIETLGVIDLKQIETTNHAALVNSNTLELEYLEEQKKFYSQGSIDLDKENTLYREFFNGERDLDERIFNEKKVKNELQQKLNYSLITLKLYEREVQDLNSQDDFYDFINMPGMESRYFRLENPDSNLMNEQYVGGSLRYMFTRGRTFFLIGVAKPFGGTAQGDDVANDIVSYAVGKDFYPRYLGNGKRRYFNPFSGFEIGGMVLTSNNSIKHVFTVEPHLGVEFFKNDYFIIDTRVGYLFPLDPDMIKTYRGLTHNLSINFVF